MARKIKKPKLKLKRSQVIKKTEEDEYNPRKQLKELLEWQKEGNRVDKKILNKLMIDSKKFA